MMALLALIVVLAVLMVDIKAPWVPVYSLTIYESGRGWFPDGYWFKRK
jgi:hypothetical protein